MKLAQILRLIFFLFHGYVKSLQAITFYVMVILQIQNINKKKNNENHIEIIKFQNFFSFDRFQNFIRINMKVNITEIITDSIKWIEVRLISCMMLYLHTYIIGHCNHSVRITAYFSHSCCVR